MLLAIHAPASLSALEGGRAYGFGAVRDRIERADEPSQPRIESDRRAGFMSVPGGRSRQRLGASAGLVAVEVIDLHLERLKEQIESQRRLCRRFDAIAARLRSAGEVSADEFLRAIEETIMIETYFTTEQLERMKERRAGVGDEGLRRKMAEW